jgi:hypothetical protein
MEITVNKAEPIPVEPIDWKALPNGTVVRIGNVDVLAMVVDEVLIALTGMNGLNNFGPAICRGFLDYPVVEIVGIASELIVEEK